MARLLGQQQRFDAVLDRLLGDDAALDVGTARDLEHAVQEHVLDDRLEAACPGPAGEGSLGDRPQGPFVEGELHVVQGEELLVLLHEGVLGLGEDADDVLLVEVIEGDHDRQPADELGDEPVLEEILGLELAEQLGRLLGAALLQGLAGEADGPAAGAVLDDLLQTVESASADEEDVGRVDLDEVLVRMLAPALGRHVGHRPLEDLEQCLLNALAAHVARDRGVVGLARNLVDLVDVDDPPLRAGDVEVGRLDEPEKDVLDILADVARLREAGRIGDAEWDVEDLGERLRQQGLAAAGRAHQEDVGLLELDVAVGLAVCDASEVVVDGDGEHLLGVFLADHVLIQRGHDHLRRRHHPRLDPLRRGRAVVLLEDLLAEIDALIADVDARARHQLADLLLSLPAEGAAGVPTPIFAVGHVLTRIA